MEKYCISCGMPLARQEDVGIETDRGPVCKFCVDSEGKVKNCREIFEGGVQFFMNSVPGTDRTMAERITRKNMKSQPMWQGKDEECLRGEEATDEEFKKALDSLHSEIEEGNVNV